MIRLNDIWGWLIDWWLMTIDIDNHYDEDEDEGEDEDWWFDNEGLVVVFICVHNADAFWSRWSECR